MTSSTFVNGTDTINEHTVAAGKNTVTVLVEGSLRGARIRLNFRKNKGSALKGTSFDEDNGVLIGTGVRLVNVVTGMILWPVREAGGRQSDGSDVTVEILDEA